ncbi:hypothetical protein JCM10908_005676 [Rhodotorula pacifica]|uniref:uncharacterized protein n=1 Tax=Rhodotorula pacifica TaxID=1495444 RepID=UPI003177DF89
MSFPPSAPPLGRYHPSLYRPRALSSLQIEKQRLFSLVDKCAHTAGVLTGIPAYGTGWKAILFSRIEEGYKMLDMVRRTVEHFEELLDNLEKRGPTYAIKDSADALYPFELHNQICENRSGPPLLPRQFHLTPQDVLTSMYGYGLSRLRNLHLEQRNSRLGPALREWSVHTESFLHHYAQQLTPAQMEHYTRALLAVLDGMYRQEDAAWAAGDQTGTVGLEYLFADGLPPDLGRQFWPQMPPPVHATTSNWSTAFVEVQKQAVEAYNRRNPHDKVSSLLERREAFMPRRRYSGDHIV